MAVFAQSGGSTAHRHATLPTTIRLGKKTSQEAQSLGLKSYDSMQEETTDVVWQVPGQNAGGPRSPLTRQALDAAKQTAKIFDACYTVRSMQEKERSLAQFDPLEFVLTEKLRFSSYYVEYPLVKVDDEADQFQCLTNSDRSYSIKFLQPGIMEQAHAEYAAEEVVLEAKLLMNLAPHPYISQLYGISCRGIESLLVSGQNGYFFLTDRIGDTLHERFDVWKSKLYQGGLVERLHVALAIASAVLHLHQHDLVCYLRPDKVGFSIEDPSKVKLFNLGQSRQFGTERPPRAISHSDNIRVLAYTAPEVFCAQPAQPSVDVYAFGIMLWEIMTLQWAFPDLDRAQHFERVVRGHERPPTDQPGWNSAFLELLCSCVDSSRRATMTRVHSSLEASLLYPSADLVDVALSVDEALSPKSGQHRHADECSIGSGFASDDHEVGAVTLTNDRVRELEKLLTEAATALKSAGKTPPSKEKKGAGKSTMTRNRKKTFMRSRSTRRLSGKGLLADGTKRGSNTVDEDQKRGKSSAAKGLVGDTRSRGSDEQPLSLFAGKSTVSADSAVVYSASSSAQRTAINSKSDGSVDDANNLSQFYEIVVPSEDDVSEFLYDNMDDLPKLDVTAAKSSSSKTEVSMLALPSPSLQFHDDEDDVDDFDPFRTTSDHGVLQSSSHLQINFNNDDGAAFVADSTDDDEAVLNENPTQSKKSRKGRSDRRRGSVSARRTEERTRPRLQTQRSGRRSKSRDMGTSSHSRALNTGIRSMRTSNHKSAPRPTTTNNSNGTTTHHDVDQRDLGVTIIRPKRRGSASLLIGADTDAFAKEEVSPSAGSNPKRGLTRTRSASSADFSQMLEAMSGHDIDDDEQTVELKEYKKQSSVKHGLMKLGRSARNLFA